MLPEIISNELEGLYGGKVLEDMGEIINLYDFYDGRGQQWETALDLDYKPTKLVTNFCKTFIDRESRCMFSRTPEISIRNKGVILSAYQIALKEVLEKSSFSTLLLKGFRDYLIGKRIAIEVIGQINEPVRVKMYPSPEFTYERNDADDSLKKIIFFYNLNNTSEKKDQRIWRKKYKMAGRRCFITEGVYDGYGELVEDGDCRSTGLDFIPCKVVLNGGLLGDDCGESDVEKIIDIQKSYNRISSDSIDSLRFDMFPQRVAIDIDEESLENMILAPGALVDITTNPAAEGQASLAMLESTHNCATQVESTLARLKQDMLEMLDFAFLGERCDEHWLVWESAIIWMCRTVIKMLSIFEDKDFGDDYDVLVLNKRRTIV